MKIALVVFRFGPSHGSILQTYALTRALESLGHDVTIIDRQKPHEWQDYDACLRRVVKNLIGGKFSWSDFYLGSFSNVMMSKLNVFINAQLRSQTITISKDKELRRIGAVEYDAYIVGSDQTWRPKYVYNVYNYFLDFVPSERKVKRIAYAPSFGTSEWEYSFDQEEKCKVLITLFDGVSVREDDGVAMCKKHFGVDAEHVVDPTMLLTGDDYREFVISSKEEPYIGYNFLDFSEDKLSKVKNVSEALGLPSKALISMGDDKKTARERIAPSIEEWISGIANSEFVLVDSFHATVFCILFHKNFITIGNEARGLSRFTSLLKMVGLENRLLNSKEPLTESLIKERIDWAKVDEKLASMRESSICFLKNSFS